jgi:hypothetical protein
MRLVRGNFPDEVWGRLKAWAKVQAQGCCSPTVDECAAYVEHTAKEITGRPNALPIDVVRFYAAETAEMIASIREAAGAIAANMEAGA